MDYKVVDAIRIAIGTLAGAKSSAWRFWGNKKGDVYASARSMGNIFKISLHREVNVLPVLPQNINQITPILFKIDPDILINGN